MQKLSPDFPRSRELRQDADRVPALAPIFFLVCHVVAVGALGAPGPAIDCCLGEPVVVGKLGHGWFLSQTGRVI